MNFEELNNTIPYVRGGKMKVLKYSPYPGVTIAMPGRHGEQTVPKHGDFVVMVNDPIYATPDHQFKHDDIFNDIEAKTTYDCQHGVMAEYLKIIQGADIDTCVPFVYHETTMATPTFYAAVQCLAVAEHRRYAQHEARFGGRFLPFRFAAGIAEGLWSAEAACAVQKKGRPGVEWLEKDFGVPSLTKELMK